MTTVEALAIIHDAVVGAGGQVIGSWPVDGYEGKGKALRDGRFVGLPLDNDNQPEATEKRLEGWLNQVREEL